MNHAIAARQATRLFWGVVGSSLLVVSGVTLAWLLVSRHDLPMTVFEACVMMMRHFRGIVYHQVDGLSVMHVLGLVFMASGVWAGGRHLMAWWRTRRFLTIFVKKSRPDSNLKTSLENRTQSARFWTAWSKSRRAIPRF